MTEADTPPRRRHLLVAAILMAATTGYLWWERVLPAAGQGFDLAALRGEVRQLFGSQPFYEVPIEPHPQLPEEQFLLVGPSQFADVISCYAGHHTSNAWSATNPHSPTICYPVEGFDLAQGPSPLQLELPGGGTTTVEIVRVTRGSDAMRTVFWTQESQAASILGEGRVEAIQRRIRTGRSDSVWVRIEFRDPGPDASLRGETLRKIGQLIAAADRCFQ